MNLSKEILAKANQYRDYTARNLSKLVQTKSLSTKEKQVAELIKSMMEEASFDEVFIDGLGNVIGRIGNGKKIIAIDGHIDTVDVGNLKNWSFDPFSGEIKDGFVFGRGSVDQKGGVASFITAGKILKEIGLNNDVTVYFVGSVMEEDCDGLCWKFIIEEDKIKPDVVILTEPTKCNIYRGHRGRMEIEVEFRGISAHGSAPERGKNAIYMAAHSLIEIEKLNENLAFDDFLGKGSVTVSQIVSDSPSLCAVADYCRFHLDRRLTFGENKELALNQIEKIVSKFNGEVKLLYYEETSFTGRKYGMEKYYPTWKMELDHPAVQNGIKSYKDLFNSDPVVDKWTFSTNGVVIRGLYGIPAIGFGPGDEVFAHAPDERIPIDDLVKASAFYAMYCQTF
ncbi:MAG: YgeY family selenium metabolism-linked hydrolase [Ignavibacteria bacterium]|nr:YgeY family selenium metabolism-linked hydrolase [Ignavibacteria bacterium]MDH7528239.1 YgeY family selenium metabolism-linked hydrolase [Ignavibacteria bacterium]